MQLVAKDRMREIKLWSTLKKEFDDGSFDTQDVNRHQLDSYHHIMKNKAETLTSGSSQPEVFNVLLGQLKTIERVKKSGEMIYNKKEQLTSDLEQKKNKKLFFLVDQILCLQVINQNLDFVSITLEIMKDLFLKRNR